MSKIFSAVLSLAFVCALTGCGDTVKKTETTTNPATGDTTTKETKVSTDSNGDVKKETTKTETKDAAGTTEVKTEKKAETK